MQKHTFSAYIYPDHHQMMTSVSVRRRPDVLFFTSLIQTLIYLFPSSLVNAKFAGEIIILEPNTLTPEKGQTSLPVLIKVASPFLEMSRCTCLLKDRRHCFIRLCFLQQNFLSLKFSLVFFPTLWTKLVTQWPFWVVRRMKSFDFALNLAMKASLGLQSLLSGHSSFFYICS